MTAGQKSQTRAGRGGRAVRAGLSALSAGTMSIGVLALLLNVACYSYDPRTPAELSTGQDVFVYVNAAGQSIVGPTLGDSIAVVQGKYVSGDASSLHVAATDVQFVSGISSPRANVDVTLPRAAYDSVTTKRLAVASTAWVVAGVIAGLVILIKGINVAGGGTDRPTSPPVPPVTK